MNRTFANFKSYVDNEINEQLRVKSNVPTLHERSFVFQGVMNTGTRTVRRATLNKFIHKSTKWL